MSILTARCKLRSSSIKDKPPPVMAWIPVGLKTSASSLPTCLGQLRPRTTNLVRWTTSKPNTPNTEALTIRLPRGLPQPTAKRDNPSTAWPNKRSWRPRRGSSRLPASRHRVSTRGWSRTRRDWLTAAPREAACKVGWPPTLTPIPKMCSTKCLSTKYWLLQPKWTQLPWALSNLRLQRSF